MTAKRTATHRSGGLLHEYPLLLPQHLEAITFYSPLLFSFSRPPVNANLQAGWSQAQPSCVALFFSLEVLQPLSQPILSGPSAKSALKYFIIIQKFDNDLLLWSNFDIASFFLVISSAVLYSFSSFPDSFVCLASIFYSGNMYYIYIHDINWPFLIISMCSVQRT